MVTRLGFEPKTHSLEGCCSIQLSYQAITFAAAKVRLFSMRGSGEAKKKQRCRFIPLSWVDKDGADASAWPVSLVLKHLRFEAVTS